MDGLLNLRKREQEIGVSWHVPTYIYHLVFFRGLGVGHHKSRTVFVVSQKEEQSGTMMLTLVIDYSCHLMSPY